MFGTEKYINRIIKNPVYSETKWTVAVNSVAFVNEAANSPKLILINCIIANVVNAARYTLTDQMRIVLVDINPVTNNAGETVILYPSHVIQSTSMRITATGVLQFSVGYQWIAEAKDENKK